MGEEDSDVNSCFLLGTFILTNPAAAKEEGSYLPHYVNGYKLYLETDERKRFDRRIAIPCFSRELSFKGLF